MSQDLSMNMDVETLETLSIFLSSDTILKQILIKFNASTEENSMFMIKSFEILIFLRHKESNNEVQHFSLPRLVQVHFHE